jgi:dihydropteroate synthase
MIAEGASIIDIGGESTRPGATPVSVTDELDRVLPVVEQVSAMDATVSIDTRKAEVADQAIDAGASIINDVSGLGDPEMRFVAAEHEVPIVLMHSIETPVNPAKEITYDDVVEECIRGLRERILSAEQAGIPRSNIIIDPGLGFGKSPQENFQLVSRLHEFHALDCPVLLGHSHKSMFDSIGYGPADRSECTIAASAIAADRGADIIRVHDVKENVAALRTIQAINKSTY